MNQIIRVIKYTFQHITRNVWQSFLIIMILTVLMLMGQLFAIVSIASDRILTYLENQPQVTVFFKDETTSDQIEQIKRELEKDSLIESVSYITKEQAYEIYKAQHKNEPELLEFVTPDILPASLDISARQVEYLSNIAKQFQNNEFVERVIFQQDLVDELTSWTDAVRFGGGVLLGVLLLISIGIILIVVTNNINTFSREIEIMRLVGAGSWYIRWPFIFDGVLFALFSATYASAIMVWVLPYVQSFTDHFIATVELFPPHENLIHLVWGYTTGIGVLFTAVVSYLATRQHLKV
ncbi:hypothetical protein HGA91_00880 [candidate division WWE3 bacterium]|nr:hypothetical protein [candidate division WWE3 bacterium]